MKQGSGDTNNLDSGCRFNFHRRKMLKNSSVIIGGAENIDRAITKLNYAVAAAFHDHLSCTKSAQQFRGIDSLSNDVLINNNLSREIDHIYGNSSDNKNITNVSSETSNSEKIPSNKLRTQFDPPRQENRMCLLRKRLSKSSVETAKNVSESKNLDCNLNNSACILSAGSQRISTSLPVLATRYFGRRSKTIPSRALKRRYMGPPKTVPVQRELSTNASSTVVEKQETAILDKDTINTTEENTCSSALSKTQKKRGRKPKKVIVKCDYLTTETTYSIYENWTLKDSYTASQIDVPFWKLKPVSSFYQMEGTENINDPVFQRRHQKCEMEERRRKRWDMQRLREQKASQKLKYKSNKGKEDSILIPPKAYSFYSNPLHIEYIEVTDVLPVLAFGCTIPLFQPCEFSLPWSCNSTEDPHSSLCNSNSKGKRSRLSGHISKVT